MDVHMHLRPEDKLHILASRLYHVDGRSFCILKIVGGLMDSITVHATEEQISAALPGSWIWKKEI